MFPPSFPMTGKSFWTSEHRSLTSIWIRISNSLSLWRRTYCSSWTRPKSPELEKWRVSFIEAGVRDTWRDNVGEWIDHLCPPFYWLKCNHWRINWTSSVQDYPINVIWRTVISCFSKLWLNKDMENINLAEFSIHWQDRTTALSKLKGWCVLLLTTACAQSLILRKSQGSARLS
jgi:hypothetical protein